ncbi:MULTISPECIES: hypothetical protein [unclassified Polaribacter]|uniref:hypothetical protein n=1 Tax=unclassified Polaribacter TaxID=196858 RepID=UPI0011BDAD4D|nr:MULTISPECIES: hypothetical protein [unclassified Polaribacter]TXD50805.1 hypothetical protein ES043_14665 [Polaribacter sp. IC063]TXD57539.1 hypothetical protein ES044_14810 [Polaribacter sp. IC066]
MKTNKEEKYIQKKFENRTFTPSVSAWERLSVQLDEQPKQKKIGWFFYIGAVASILLLVLIGIQLFTNDRSDIIPENEVVIDQIDKDIIDKKLDKFINEVPLEEAVVQKDGVSVDRKKSLRNIIAKEETLKPAMTFKQSITPKNHIKNEIVLAKVEEKQQVAPIKAESVIKKSKILPQGFNNSITINSDDLLYAVTHTSKEVKSYYAKYNLNREAILKTIRNQLQESNLKVNPETILAEVERTIDNDLFQNNFMKSLKRRVTDIASAIASRND